MSWTKRQFVIQAFEEIGFASYQFDLEPEQLQAALRRLDSMMATWNGIGLRLGYPIPTSPENSDLDEETLVPDAANEAIYMNLALRIAGTVGKQVMPTTLAIARKSYSDLLLKIAQPMEKQFPGTLPSGAGNKPWRDDNPFLDRPTDPVTTGGDGPLEFN